jgi:HEAT repeat protein
VEDTLQERAPDASDSPYRNLWVPLVVVPFIVIGVLVIVYVFFGAIAGSEATVQENLRRMLEAGPNERQQAAASFAEQIASNAAALARDEPLPNPTGAEFADELLDAWERLEREENHRLRLVVARAMVAERVPGTRERLETFLVLGDADDADRQLRFNALLALGQLGEPAAAAAVIPFLEHEDGLLAEGAAMALQTLPSPETHAALEGLLEAGPLELRGMAAVSLARLGRPAAAPLLRDMTGTEIYAEERARDPAKYPADWVQHNRRTAVRALGRLGRPEDRAWVEELARDEPDPLVREEAMRVLAEWGQSPPGS